MKKILLTTIVLASLSVFSQEHFSGLSTSSKSGIIKIGINPAELTNLSHRFDVNIYGASFNVTNNKIGFKDITSGSNLESLIFKGTDPVNMRFDAEVYGPSIAFKILNWGFAVSSKASGKLDIIDVDAKLGDAIQNGNVSGYIGSNTIQSDYNQRLVGTTWGEIGLSVAKKIIDRNSYKISAGATFKLMFPGSYSNIGLDKFNGRVDYAAGQVYINDATANVNVAYSGNLANSFSNFNDYSKSVYGALNGFVGDLGFNFQIKDPSITDILKNGNSYKLNVGLSVRNIGSMKFKSENNFATNYSLDIHSTPSALLGLNLNQFQNVDNLQQVETILINNGYLNITPKKQDFVVKLPTVMNLYADLKLVSKIYVSGFVQHKLTDDNKNDQISSQNIITVTPRVNLGFFEAYLPVSSSEIAGFSGGLGFRLGGFYLGSGSIITALINDTKRADIYTGFRWAFL